MAEETFLHESARLALRSIESRSENPSAAKVAAREFVTIFSTMAGISGGGSESAKPDPKKK